MAMPAYYLINSTYFLLSILNGIELDHDLWGYLYLPSPTEYWGLLQHTTSASIPPSSRLSDSYPSHS